MASDYQRISNHHHHAGISRAQQNSAAHTLTHTKLPKHNKRATATITIATAHNKYLANNLGYCVTCGYSTQQTNHLGQNNRFNEYPVKTGYNHIKHYEHTHMIHSLVDFGRLPGPSGSMINVIKLKLDVVCVCKVFQPPMCDQAHPDLVCVFLHMHLSMISQSYGKPLSLQNILHIQFFFGVWSFVRLQLDAQ